MKKTANNENASSRMIKKPALFWGLVMVMLAAVFGGFVAPQSADAAENDGGLSEHIIDTVSPNHVKFNLFDYWVSTRDSAYNKEWGIQKGINQGHTFLFGAGQGHGTWNVWTGNSWHYNNNPNRASGVRYGEYKGIAASQLTDGYPVLALNDDVGDDLKGNPGFIKENNLDSKLTESLEYLFNPNITSEYKASYENVQGLVKYDGNGGYVYNSHENYAAFKESSGALGTNGEASDGYFDVYDSWAVPNGGLTSPNGQFFPFDGASEVFQTDTSGNYIVDESTGALTPKINVPLQSGTNLNHYTGMTMETVFLQPEDGKIDDNTPMSFTFSGDDDVWIYIDGVLVSDLGGVHDECFTIIDFETGKVYTGLTPLIKKNNTLVEDIPTIKELTEAEAGTSAETWTWCNRAESGRPNVKGIYEEFKAAHGIQSTTLKEIFDNAGQSYSQSWGSDGMSPDTFDQNTQHELKMFYLERGAGASNLVLEFNMLAVPASGITKTDQDGNPVAGAEFELWPAKVSSTVKDDYGNPAPIIEDGCYVADDSPLKEPLCTVTTDSNGQVNFVTNKRKIISFQEYAQKESDPIFYYVLKETERPVGYRSSGDISLYYSMYDKTTKEGVLLCHNYWQTGAYTQAMLDVTMTEDLRQYRGNGNGTATAGESIVPEGENPTDYLDDGIIFAVPIKRMDTSGSLYEESNFNALYGTANTGWTMMTESIEDKASVLEAAKGMEQAMLRTQQPGTVIAERNARNLFQVTVSNIPGDVKKSYPYLKDSDDVNQSEYNIAFYFAPNADSLEDIEDPGSIVRIATSYTDSEGAEQKFERHYASRFYISNIFNRVRVQKLNYYGERLTGAKFTMYQAYSYQAREGYELDAAKGLYRNPDVVDEHGNIKNKSEIVGHATSWDSGTTKAEGAGGSGGLDIDGALVFPTAFDNHLYKENQTDSYKVDSNDTSTYMEKGEYVIFETGAPAGYDVNENPIKVTVNDDGVFADAGEVNDGIRVGQYAGYIVNPLTQFAAESAVDESLTFINTCLMVRNEDGDLSAPIEGEINRANKYSNENHRYISFAEDVGHYITSGRNLYQYTDKGTPQLLITQNTDVSPKTIIFDGSYKGYTGAVTINKKGTNDNDSAYSLESIATNGTVGFWLYKESSGEKQTLQSVEINGVSLNEGTDYHVYTPKVNDLSGYEDLSSVFSVETLAQVYDQGYGDLSVTKNTENTPEGSQAKDEIFHFRVYSVFENATKVVLAKTENGEVVLDEAGQPELVNFDGTLNVRIRQSGDGAQDMQNTGTNISVDFTDGVGMLYLQPDYNVEYVYLPENKDHALYDGLSGNEGVAGLVESQITLSDKEVSGTGEVSLTHISFVSKTQELTAAFEDGEALLYHDPDYKVTGVTVNGTGYQAADGSSSGPNAFTATSSFQYTSLGNILNVPVSGEVDVSFNEANGNNSNDDRILTNINLPPEDGNFEDVKVGDGEVTVYKKGEGYKLAYSLGSDTYKDALVGQFALHSGQTVTLNHLPAGACYYVYEYAAGNMDAAEGENASSIRDELKNNWNTEITPGEGGRAIDEYRAATGTVALNNGSNSQQHVTFTNAAHVGSLMISKEVAGDEADIGAAKTYEFELTLKDKDGKPLAGTYNYTGGIIEGSSATAPSDGELKFDSNGVASISLAHGQTVTVTDLPVGTEWSIEEKAGEGYTVTAVATDGGGAEPVTAEGLTATGNIGKDAEKDIAAFTNTYGDPIPEPITGSLSIQKKVTGEGADKDKEFKFNIALKDADDNAVTGTYKYMGGIIEGSGATAPDDGELIFDSNGTASVNLSHGQIVIVKDLPVGIKYTVDEEDYSEDGYTATFENQKGSIQGANGVTVDVVNTYKAPEPGPEPPVGTPDPVTVNLPTVVKEVSKGAPEETFAFTLEGQGNAPMPEGSRDNRKNAEIVGSGETSFGEITITEEGEYVYKIYEVDGGKEGWTYDSTEYTVTVSVKNEDGKLIASVSLTNGSEEVDTATFSNNWKEPGHTTDEPNTDRPGSTDPKPSAPESGSTHTKGEANTQSTKTGDDANITVWIVLMIASCAVMTAVVLYRRNKRSDR